MATSTRLIRRVALLPLVLAALAVAGASPSAAEPRRFAIQPEASEVTFQATSRLMNAEGRFHRLGGEVVVDPGDLGTARIMLSIEAASVDTGVARRDNHLRSPDFFDATTFPTITFQSLRVEAAGRRATVTGRLTLHGVTREVAVPVDVTVSDRAIVAAGEVVLNRGDYGLVYDSFLNPIGPEVRVSFRFRARAS